MQAIQTKYLGPTNHRGCRVKATCWRTSATVAWDYMLDVEGNHRAAIAALVSKLNRGRSATLWQVIAIGESVDGKGMAAIIDLE